MAVLEWSADLEVGIAFMDEDHHEAVELINAMAEATGAELTALFARYLAHSEAHFAREERLMRDTGFFAFEPHHAEHERVLGEYRAVLATLEAGGEADVHTYLRAGLAGWLLAHRNTMDFVTAQFARGQGKE
ncbi:MAG: hemerythrin domain-containing protein [Magnetospirillum sp.]|nr:hemerythrin domain-containing protein [Magnetospirillum sp.]